MTTGPEPKVIATVLLGAEGVADELPHLVWAREATEEEIQAKTEWLRSLGRQAAHLTVDQTGRPYYWVSVLANAPRRVQQRAKSNLRMLRLSDGGDQW